MMAHIQEKQLLVNLKQNLVPGAPLAAKREDAHDYNLKFDHKGVSLYVSTDEEGNIKLALKDQPEIDLRDYMKKNVFQMLRGTLAMYPEDIFPNLVGQQIDSNDDLRQALKL